MAIEVNQIDTLTKHLIEINKQLVNIRQNTSISDANNTLKTILLFLSPFLTGYIFYLLTKNKEFRIKRADISGKIAQHMYDFRINAQRHIFNRQKHRALLTKRKLWRITSLYKNSSAEKNNKIEESYSKIFKRHLENSNEYWRLATKAKSELANYFNQYKFYHLRDNDEFDKLCVHYLNLNLPKYSFEHCTWQNINEEVGSVPEKLSKEFNEKCKNIASEIQDFLEKNIDG